MTAAKEGKITHEIVERKVGDLMVDPTVQRSVRQNRVRKMIEEGFDPTALGVLTTSYRRAKEIHIVDGQHRYALCVAIGYDGVLQTNQYRGLTPADEAALFRKLNHAEKVPAIDLFRVRRIEGDQNVEAMFRLLEDNGWRVLASVGDGAFGAVGALERIWVRDNVAAQRAIVALTVAFGRKAVAMQGPLVEGVGLFFAKYGDAVDINDFAKKLGAFQGGPAGLVGYAKGQKATGSGTLSVHVARIVTNVYNNRRRSTKLPDWQ